MFKCAYCRDECVEGTVLCEYHIDLYNLGLVEAPLIRGSIDYQGWRLPLLLTIEYDKWVPLKPNKEYKGIPEEMRTKIINEYLNFHSDKR